MDLLSPLEKEFGVKIKRGNGTFDEAGFSIKISVYIPGKKDAAEIGYMNSRARMLQLIEAG